MPRDDRPDSVSLRHVTSCRDISCRTGSPSGCSSCTDSFHSPDRETGQPCPRMNPTGVRCERYRPCGWSQTL
ncbi:Hypp1586 [Branchiostoma lanceolatum]|uniref:Hypp1586 protein n=1 Tax=Branchiostoma lanceolatum TaxID=7740 RepID=A0A8J9ZJ96_BRALA|nr:Hypp1586 [Branchiostoma lanceolatum]